MLGQELTMGVKLNMDVSEVGDGENIGERDQNSAQRVRRRMYYTRSGTSFVYVPYRLGQITYVETDADCISSRFTGCVMAKFKKNKKVCVAHVCSERNSDWLIMKKEIELICEFKPSDLSKGDGFEYLKQSMVNNTKTGKASDCFGIIEANNKKYAGYFNRESINTDRAFIGVNIKSPKIKTGVAHIASKSSQTIDNCVGITS